ncbi:phage major tail protein, TP901-1 family [Streptococcus pyogenes]|uniref:phage major tail protein, TP901-1 family n=1 Tax=Streptococcus pyogenes TaxID=1314 RepID=UPI00109B9ABB|nr:phage major tail protein, TP901-1 family [Streptococcus pyogenes]VGQ77563.1 major tail protein [Streptococcus pyogenes]VGV12356.1 major tail protein [Streptococcus pyogenes]VHC64099.1 major tail protein [Streptococcus pyogenes]
MAELIQGKSFLLFFRRFADAKNKSAAKLRFQTEHSIKMEKETEATKTKDGVVNSLSDGENTIDIKSLAYKEDNGTTSTWKELREWFKKGDLVEIWQVDLSSEKSEGYEVEYFQGYFKSFEISAPADGKVELSVNYAINGNGVEGKDTLSEDQKQAVANIQYKYTKMEATKENSFEM